MLKNTLAEWFHTVVKPQGTVADSTRLSSQKKLSQQAKGRVIKLKLQHELFPLLRSEGNAGESRTREQEDRVQRGLPVQERGGIGISTVCELIGYSQVPNSYFACYFLFVTLGSQGTEVLQEVGLFSDWPRQLFK